MHYWYDIPAVSDSVPCQACSFFRGHPPTWVANHPPTLIAAVEESPARAGPGKPVRCVIGQMELRKARRRGAVDSSVVSADGRAIVRPE